MARSAGAGTGETGATALDPQIERLREAQRTIRGQLGQIQAGYAALAEALAASARELTATAAEADFSPPPWPRDTTRMVEIRLAQTREISFRLHTGAGGDVHGPPV